MDWNRVIVCSEVSERLRTLKMRTGLTPNILCRFGFCLSLREPDAPDPGSYDSGGAEFNRFTLTGEFDKLFFALFRERCAADGIKGEESAREQFRAHLNRGVLLLFQSCRNLIDLERLLLSRSPSTS
jgi:DNA sulfur modification protein DndE